MLLRDTVTAVLRYPLVPKVSPPEVERELVSRLPRPLPRAHGTVLVGVRRSGKSTLQLQLMRREGASLYCNFEDTRLFGMTPEDFPTFLSLVDELAPGQEPVFLDEVQAVEGWQRLVRALIDAGRAVCLTGSNASLLGSELGTRLTGRHLSFAVFPFSYREYCAYRGTELGAESFRAYLDEGGFPGYLRERHDLVLQELLRDVVQRDVAARHRLRETRHLMNLLLYLLANTGQPCSFQRLTKKLGVPTVAQTSRYVEFLEDAYLIFTAAKFSSSFSKRAAGAAKYYAIDNGLRRANSPQLQPDLGHRLENAVALQLRRLGLPVQHAGERDLWECDFVTSDEAIQVSVELTPANRRRELGGLVQAARLAGRRRGLVVTLNQTDRLREDGLEVDVVPAWRWM